MPLAYYPDMPDIEFAFIADAAETTPGQKFHVLGGGVSRIGGPGFPLRHPHLALVICLQVATSEFGREHEVRIVLHGPDGQEVAGAVGRIAAAGAGDGRPAFVTFSVDLWSIVFPDPGDYSFRLLVNGAERKLLPLVLSLDAAPAAAQRVAPGPGQKAGEPVGPRRYDA